MMTLTKRTPDFQIATAVDGWDLLDRWFDGLTAPRTGRVLGGARRADGVGLYSPPVDIAHEGERIVLRAELPGVKSEDVEVTVHDNTLTLKGTKKIEVDEENGGYRYSERQHGEFTRTFQLPATVDASNVKAEFKDGVLHVFLPLAEEAKPKKIEIAVK